MSFGFYYPNDLHQRPAPYNTVSLKDESHLQGPQGYPSCSAPKSVPPATESQYSSS